MRDLNSFEEEGYGLKSLWGALGSIFLLQVYALFLLYSFVAAVRNIPPSLSELDGLLGNIVAYFVGFIFLSIFVYFQGRMIDYTIAFLKAEFTFSALLKELLTLSGIIRFSLSLALVYFYFLLILGKIDLGFPTLNIYISIAYQLFLFIVGSLFRKTEQQEVETEERYVSALSQIVTMLLILLAGCVFYGGSLMMHSKSIPVYWVFQSMGATFFTLGLLAILTTDIKGEVRRVPLQDNS